MDNFATPQEEFWAGTFGSEYISRNMSNELLASNIAFFAEVLSSLDCPPNRILEIGANVGMNIVALKHLLPSADFTGIEINKTACEILKNTGCKVINQSILTAEIDKKYDLVLSKGVLIHITPEMLPTTYEKIYESAFSWILLAEYYNPTPTSLPYRGVEDRLFKRDFAGEMIALFPDLKLHDYGFRYHRGMFPQDDISWFLLRKDKKYD